MGTFRAKHKSVQILNHVKGLSPIQKELFLASLKAGKLKNISKKNLLKQRKLDKLCKA
jgi:hypothetical protein